MKNSQVVTQKILDKIEFEQEAKIPDEKFLRLTQKNLRKHCKMMAKYRQSQRNRRPDVYTQGEPIFLTKFLNL